MPQPIILPPNPNSPGMILKGMMPALQQLAMMKMQQNIKLKELEEERKQQETKMKAAELFISKMDKGEGASPYQAAIVADATGVDFLKARKQAYEEKKGVIKEWQKDGVTYRQRIDPVTGKPLAKEYVYKQAPREKVTEVQPGGGETTRFINPYAQPQQPQQGAKIPARRQGFKTKLDVLDRPLGPKGVLAYSKNGEHPTPDMTPAQALRQGYTIEKKGIASEKAGKIQAAEQAQEDITKIRSLVYKKGPDGNPKKDEEGHLIVDRVNLFNKWVGTPFSEGRTLANVMYNGIENKVRISSGAAVPPEEFKRFIDLTLPKLGDSDELIRMKLDKYENYVNGIVEKLDPNKKYRQGTVFVTNKKGEKIAIQPKKAIPSKKDWSNTDLGSVIKHMDQY